MKVLVMINNSTYAYNLRGALLRHILSQGHEVVVVCQMLKMQQELADMGCRLIDVDNGRRSTNPLNDLKLIGIYRHILLDEKPDVVLTYNIKPNAYGGMLCQKLGIKYLANVTGLGTPLENPGKLRWLFKLLYKKGVAGASCLFFQNEDNRRFFEENGMLRAGAHVRELPGSGVDLTRHQPKPWHENEPVYFLFIARVMKEKGIDLYLNAARRIHAAHPETMFHICGGCDDEQYIRILHDAEQEGFVQYHGEQANVAPFFEQAHCIVHPSYYPEGMSNVLLEAGASARPIITTDRPGCRETVDDGKTGLLIPVCDEDKLVEALERFLAMSWQERRQMGEAGREKISRQFDRRLVVDAYAEEMGIPTTCL